MSDTLPIEVERCARSRSAALHVAADEHRRIHRTCRCSRDRLDLQPRFLEQPVKHAPRERAVRAAALKRKVNENRGPVLFARLPSICFHVVSTIRYRPTSRVSVPPNNRRPRVTQRGTLPTPKPIAFTG